MGTSPIFIISLLLAIAGIAFLPFDQLKFNRLITIISWILCLGIPAVYYGLKELIAYAKEELKKRK